MMEKIYTHVERVSTTPIPSLAVIRAFYAAGLAMTPVFLLASALAGGPGTRAHLRASALGLKLLLRRRISAFDAFLLTSFPLDSVRYFEFDVFWRWMCERQPGRYLDVSSPRLLFVLLMENMPELHSWLVNPDRNDLAATRELLQAAGLENRCTISDALISDVDFPPASFDTITSMSVIEHIPEPDDIAAVERIWDMLRPGGHLFISVPCAAVRFEQYIDSNDYGILAPGPNGYAYAQRFYDESLLQSRLFDIIGRPNRMRLYGEKTAGTYMANCAYRNRYFYYPFWRESYMMATRYRYFDRVSELPGLGVAAMEFVK
jgi:predicted SAM-dependent methyltransferase